MNLFQVKRYFAAVSMGAGLSLAAIAPASAVPIFSVNHTPLSGQVGCVAACPQGTGADFQANQITGNASTLLTRQADNSVVGSGWINLTGFTLDNIAVVPGISRVGVDYQLWATFSYTLTPISGSFGQAGSLYNVAALSVNVFGQNGLGVVFTAANASTNTAATVNAGAAQQIGAGVGLAGEAGLNSLGGAYFNSAISYSNTAFGDTYFVFPVPFYNFAFNQFNNTSQGILQNGNLLSINQATGSIDFQTVPTPGSLALVGVALIGAGFVSRRRKQG